jgi:hypothetical protein
MSPTFAAGPDRPRHDDRALEFRRDAAGGAFRFAEFSCNDRAADRLERRLDRMAGKLKLSREQEKLFEDFRTSALTAQTDFADQCATIRPGKSANRSGRPDLIQRLEQRLKFDEARLAAMSELVPQFKSFYESLTDAQKREFAPRRHMQGKFQHPGKLLNHHPAAPGLDG